MKRYTESKKIKILAIDDNKDNLISLKALIKEAFPDVRILLALSGEKGLELAAAEDPRCYPSRHRDARHGWF